MGWRDHGNAVVTYRNGEYIPAQCSSGTHFGGKAGEYINAIYSSSGHGGNNAFISAAVFKNYGYNATTSAWETWFSTGAASISNPSGATLTQYQNIRVA